MNFKTGGKRVPTKLTTCSSNQDEQKKGGIWTNFGTQHMKKHTNFLK